MVPTADAALAMINQGLDLLAEAQPGVDHVQALMQARHRVDAATTRCVRRVMWSGQTDNIPVAPWLAWKCRIRKGDAQQLVANGRAMEAMPEAAASFDAGVISAAHIRELGRAQRLAPEAFSKAESELVHDAETLRFDRFRSQVKYFEQLAEPDRVEDRARDAFERREAHCSKTFEDTVRVDATMDPIGGAIWQRELERLEQLEFEHDWAEARAAYGDRATVRDLERTPAQRRHDAMVKMALNSAAKPANAKEARILLSILVGYETMAGRVCELADGTVITPGQIVPWLDRADVERAVFGPDRRVIDLGRRSRLFRGGARRAVELSDLECTDEGCDVRFERCDVDHIQRWEHGGATDRDNGRLRCPRHNDGRRRPLPPEPPPDP